MSKIRYFELIDEFCLLSGGAQPEVQPRMITDGGALYVNDVSFSLLHNEQIDDTLLFIYADFGALPPGRELYASIALLEANLYLYSDAAPVFAISQETERVVMAQHCVLSKLDAQDLRQLLINMAAKATQWRSDYFLNPDTNPFQVSAASL